MSSTAIASTGTHCVRGGGVNINLPSNSYHLYMQNNQSDGVNIKIFERTIDASRGDLVLKAYVEFVKKDKRTLQSTYSSRDGRIALTLNERQDGKVLSAYISGTGEGLDQRKIFAFEGRSCGQAE
jgi:hypothetical protein